MHELLKHLNRQFKTLHDSTNKMGYGLTLALLIHINSGAH